MKDNPQNNLIKDETKGSWYTGSQLGADVQAIKAALVKLKVGYQDTVLVCLPNMAAYPILVQAIWEVGAIAHPVAATTPEAELKQILDAHDYTAAVVQATLTAAAVHQRPATISTLRLHTAYQMNIIRYSEAAGHFAQEPAETDLALILNTSGTTGKPKRVGLTHELIKNGAEHDIESHQMTALDTTLIVMPMFHINAQVVCVLATRLSGGKLVIAEKFSASKFWAQVQANQVTWVSVVPTIINILLMNKAARKAYQSDIRLRFVRCSSFALPLDKLTKFQKLFHTIILEGYGMTETASQCTLNPFDAPKVGSAGKPYKTDVAILVDGHISPIVGEVGEIIVRGDHVISDYMEPHPESFMADWFLTGDLGYFDEDGYLFVKGRKKDIINRGGEKVAPAQVENVLSQLDFVKEVAVIGTPDELYGEAVTAVIISRSKQPDAQLAQQIKAFARLSLANYERPTRIVFVKDYPRNATGKVIRQQLKTQILTASVGESA